jgi:cell division protein FtsQ
MKIIKFIVSFLLFLGILVLMVWAIVKSNDRTCNQISILINHSGKYELLTKSDVLQILKQNNLEWEGKANKEIELSSINKILARENYIKTVDNVHFLGTKLQIEVTLYDILLEVQPQNGDKFLLDVNGVYLPYSPKVENDVIVAQGKIPYNFRKKETVTFDDNEMYELFTIASLIHEDPFYSDLFHQLSVNDKQEIILHPSVGNLPVLFGTAQDAQNKLKSLRYMYKEVLPYMDENQYAQLDVRFKNRIVATKPKT